MNEERDVHIATLCALVSHMILDEKRAPGRGLLEELRRSLDEELQGKAPESDVLRAQHARDMPGCPGRFDVCNQCGWEP